MPNNNKLKPLVICVDIAAFAFMGYAACLIVWASLHTEPDDGAMPWRIKLYLDHLFYFAVAAIWLFYRYITDWYERHPFLGSLVTNPKFRIYGDTASTIFLGYIFYIIVWGLQHPGPMPKPMPLQFQLAIADIFPGAIALCWFCYRYVMDWSERYPFILNMMKNKRLGWVFPTVAIIVAILTAHFRR